MWKNFSACIPANHRLVGAPGGFRSFSHVSARAQLDVFMSPLTPPLKKYLLHHCFEAWVNNFFFPELKNVPSCSVISDFSKRQVSIFRAQWSSRFSDAFFQQLCKMYCSDCIWVCATEAICTSMLAYCCLKFATVGIYEVGEFASLSRIGQ